MKDRILEFMRLEGLTNGRLAEIIGVQPSNISHIISGRNKPGFEFIANLLKRFPRLNPHWLILGIDEVYLSQGTEQSDFRMEGLFSTEESKTPTHSTVEPNKNHIEKSLEKQTIVNSLFSDDIERVILLKRDGTFVTYTLNNQT